MSGFANGGRRNKLRAIHEFLGTPFYVIELTFVSNKLIHHRIPMDLTEHI